MKPRDLHWIVLGIILTALLWQMAKDYIGVIVYGLFIYYISRRPYKWILSKVENKWVSAFISLILIILPLIIVIGYTLGIAAIEFRQLLRSWNIDSVGIVKTLLGESGITLETLAASDIFNMAKANVELGRTIYRIILGALGIVFKFLLTFVAAFYILVDGSKLKKWFITAFFKQERKLVSKFFDDIDNAFYRVFFGNILTAGFTAVVGAITFKFLNLLAPHPALLIPYPVLLGILCGFGNLIPVIGMKIIWIPTTVYLIFQLYVYSIFPHIWFILIFLIMVNIFVDLFPDNILRPYMTGGHVHFGVMFFAYILGAAAFGFMGIFLGPMVVIVSSNFVKTILPSIKDQTMRGLIKVQSD